ncbi:MAG: Asp-tRNA(Asn)/Glu-tRNA(Gln) amidotransferase subunit GatC [Candidatus Pacebacteria bacterium]|nr:Asp-tRNA(Asn)/Glu-tRNA(Gln) amidotransferase subunit GatC [Candidatus Paceibacterota bacterium]
MQLEDVKKLADLARIDMSDEEMTKIAKDFDPILAYVGQVQEALKLSEKISLENKKPENYFLHNVMREDVVANSRGEYTEKIIAEMPDTQDGFLKVKQIL